MKVLIDTCVIIDALQSRKPFSENAEKSFSPQQITTLKVSLRQKRLQTYIISLTV